MMHFAGKTKETVLGLAGSRNHLIGAKLEKSRILWSSFESVLEILKKYADSEIPA